MSENKNILMIASSLESGVIDKSVIDIACVLKKNGFEVSVVSAGGKMVKELRKEGINHYLLPVNSNDFFVVRHNLRKIMEIVRQEEITLIHTFTPQSSFYGFKISRTMQVPYITSFLKIYPRTFWPFTKKKINYLTKGACVIVPSEYMASYIQIAYHVPSEKIVIIPQWIDTDLFNAHNVSAERIISTASDFRIPEDHFIITTVGKLEKSKGQALLINAVAKLPPEIRNKIRCVVIGSFKEHKRYKSELEKLMRKLGVEDIVHLAGEANDTPALLMLSDVYIATNVEPKASLITLLEAESLGRPIIASNIGSTPEYILDNETCKMFNPNNIDELVDAIVWALKITEEERSEISQKLSTNVRLNFSKSVIPQRIVNIYNYVLGLK